MFVKNQEFHGKCVSEPVSYTRFHNMVDMLLTYFLTYLHFAAQGRKVFKEKETYGHECFVQVIMRFRVQFGINLHE